MMNKRLLRMAGDSKKYIAATICCQWVSLVTSVVTVFAIARFLERLLGNAVTSADFIFTGGVIIAAVCVRFTCDALSSRMSHLASAGVKKRLRRQIYEKLQRLGISYHERSPTSETVQLSVEGVEQLEVYFSRYLPQLFYSLLAPITLFVVLAPISLPSALVLLLCVPLIPLSIMMVRKYAGRLMKKYWKSYASLGGSFLENLQGLTTLKIYGMDGARHEQMNEQAESFRKITMKVLTMQLYSVTVMDLIAYGGTAAGLLVAASQYLDGNLGFSGALTVVLLSAEFFLPLRLLGSYFHTAMGGMTAANRIFNLLDLPEPPRNENRFELGSGEIAIENVDFSYDGSRPTLRGVSVRAPRGKLTALVGKSGCGKSTIASLILGTLNGYSGSIRIGGQEVSSLSEEEVLRNVTLVRHNSYLFSGSVHDNLRMGNPQATEEEMVNALKKVNIYDHIMSQGGLSMNITEQGANLSSGQRQRIAIARALLHDTPIYLFDEAASNVDVESENAIMRTVQDLARTRTVLLISHRLANIVNADRIYVMENGRVAETGTHGELTVHGGVYADLFRGQDEIERATRAGKEAGTYA